MDIQQIIANAVTSQRSEDMKTSEQLTLGELILKVEAIQDKSKPVVFDEQKYRPDALGSWRGSYEELAIEYDADGKLVSTADFLKKLKDTVGSTVYGYKGGEYRVGKITPVWVANYGNSGGFTDETQAVVDVAEDEQHVILVTRNMKLKSYIRQFHAAVPPVACVDRWA